MKEKGINPITPVLVCGGAEGKQLKGMEGAVAAGKDPVITMISDPDTTDRAGSAAPGQSGKEPAAIPDTAAPGQTGRDRGDRAGSGSGTKASPDKGQEKKLRINFDFLQKLGKVLMAVIAVMPAAGLMISLGKLVQMGGADIHMVMMIGSTMENIGWAIINNLHILFAVAIGGSWAKERAGGAFAAVIAFVLINCITI